MKYLALFSLLLPNLIHAYTGTNNTEAVVTFSHWVELGDKTGVRDAEAAVEEQITYIFGPLSLGKYVGSPKLDDYKWEKHITLKPRNEDGMMIAHYDYKGTMALKIFAETEVEVPLPNNPFTLFQTSENAKATLIEKKEIPENSLNLCTDETYQSYGDFWYFWSIKRPGCSKLLKKGKDYELATLTIKRLPNMEVSYPRYTELPDGDGHIEVLIVMGKDVASRIRSPENRKGRADDLNAANYRGIVKGLKEMGFKERTWTNTEVKKIVREALSPYPFVQEFVYEYDNDRAKDLKVVMVYNNVDVGHQSNGFYYFLEHGLEKMAATIYDGHSGLGGNIDFKSMRDSLKKRIHFNFPKKRYQILFFNSCTSYAYYNLEFFAKKIIEGSRDTLGHRYLNVLATALETPFEGGIETDLALVKAIHSWADKGHWTSWQTLAKKMENENLIGINGDEDNPTAPPQPK